MRREWFGSIFWRFEPKWKPSEIKPPFARTLRYILIHTKKKLEKPYLLTLFSLKKMTKKNQANNSPRAHTACSQTFCCGDFNNLRNKGTASASTTAWVCCEVPEAIFVSAQAASNCSEGLSISSRHLTYNKIKKKPEFKLSQKLIVFFSNISNLMMI